MSKNVMSRGRRKMPQTNSTKSRRRGRAGGRPRNLPMLDYRIRDNRFGGMPDSFQTVLEYTDVIRISSLSSGTAGYVYRGNSLYDPDYTATGHQPRYFDQNMAIYSRYQVIGAQVSVWALGETAAFMVVCPSTDPLTFTTGVNEYGELPRAKVMPIGGSYIIPTKQLVATYTTEGVLGLTHTQLQDSNYSGDVSNNPASLWYINLAVIAPVGATEVVAHVFVSISYKCLFYDRLTVTPSYASPAPVVPPPLKPPQIKFPLPVKKQD